MVVSDGATVNSVAPSPDINNETNQSTDSNDHCERPNNAQEQTHEPYLRGTTIGVLIR
jgi:hypothetical protein